MNWTKLFTHEADECEVTTVSPKARIITDVVQSVGKNIVESVRRGKSLQRVAKG